jgi:ferredoxin
MAYKISDDCINCGGCVEICENRAIFETEDKSETDPSQCTECVGVSQSPLCADVCSVNAPMPDPAQLETREELLSRWKRLHPAEVPKTK